MLIALRTDRRPSALDDARAETNRAFAAVLRGEATAAELVAALRAEYRLEGWL